MRVLPRQAVDLALITVLIIFAAILILWLAKSGVETGPKTDAPNALPGITVASDEQVPGKVVVTSVRSDSEAATKGVEAGDHIVAIDGQPVRTARDVAHRTGAHRGATIELTLQHGVRWWKMVLRRRGSAHGPQAATDRG